MRKIKVRNSHANIHWMRSPLAENDCSGTQTIFDLKFFQFVKVKRKSRKSIRMCARIQKRQNEAKINKISFCFWSFAFRNLIFILFFEFKVTSQLWNALWIAFIPVTILSRTLHSIDFVFVRDSPFSFGKMFFRVFSVVVFSSFFAAMCRLWITVGRQLFAGARNDSIKQKFGKYEKKCCKCAVKSRTNERTQNRQTTNDKQQTELQKRTHVVNFKHLDAVQIQSNA